MNRRSFLLKSTQVAAVGMTVSAGLGNLAFAEETSKKIPIALQLYSIRNAAQKDLAGVIKAVADMGYDGVEFAGYYGHKPEEIRKMLDANHLRCAGTHTGLDQLLGRRYEKTAQLHKILGTKFMIVPGGIDAGLHSVGGNDMTAKLFDELAYKAAKDDLMIGYHAHGGDFKDIDGETAWERFFGATKDNVIMQMDVGNCLGGGGNPYAVLKKFPNRSKTIHLKEHSKNGAPVGEGEVDWAKVFEICESDGGTEWYVVEHEVGDAVKLDGVEACIKNLRKMGK